MSWLQRNAGQAQQQPLPEISFIVEGREFLPASLVAPATWKDFAPNGAIPVRPVPKKQAVMRRPAAARAVPQLAHVSRRAQAASNMASQQQVAQQHDGEELLDEDQPQHQEIPLPDSISPEPGDEAASHRGPAMKRPAAAMSQDEVMRRPSAKASVQPKAAVQPKFKAQAKTKAKAKAAAVQLDAAAVHRILSNNPGQRLGCSKCRHSLAGCWECKLRAARQLI